MSHKFINEIQPGQRIDDVFMVKSPVLRSTSRGDLYIAMFLLDKTGQVNSRMWQAKEEVYNSLPKPGFVRVVGKSELYQNNLQIIVNQIAVVDPDDVDLEDFLPRTEKDTDQMFSEIKEMVSNIENDQIKAIVDSFLADNDLMEKFCKAPAAIKMHHNYLGGLLEHVHSMLKVANSIFRYYPKVNKDLVLAGIFLHDMGKTEELSYDLAFSYTDSGQLLGHISKTLLMVNRKADELKVAGVNIDKKLMDALGHIILSHHGEYEFGSPKLPATPEAFMVSYIDNLDAKLNQVTDLIENEPGDENWTRWQHSLQTKIFKGNVDL